MKCLFKYGWVKLRRSNLPSGKGIMGAWLRLASRAAFRSGQAKYCRHINEVHAGSWVGGIVGLKSILGVKTRKEALYIMDALSDLGYIEYTLDQQTKKLSYHIIDWVVKCSGEACMNGAIYATDGYGFLCVPRSITQRLLERNYVFEESDAWLDLWVHTVWQEKRNAFSGLAPVIQFNIDSPVLTLEALGQRWHWEKTKVWRLLKKYSDTFTLVKLPGAYGCLIYNSCYPTAFGGSMPAPEYTEIVLILDKIRIMAQNTHFEGSDHAKINRIVCMLSSKISIGNLNEGIPSTGHPESNCRVALSRPYYIRAYFSFALKHCQHCYQCSLGCRKEYIKQADNYNTRGLRVNLGPPLRKEDYHVGIDEKTIRATGKPAFNSIGGVYAVSRKEGPYQRHVYTVSGRSEDKAGTSADHVPQHSPALKALSKHPLGS